jgi:hypothetical protein
MLKCFVVDHQARNFDRQHVLQAIADEAGVTLDAGSGGRSYLGMPECSDKRNTLAQRLQNEELEFQVLPRIAY